MRTTCIRRAALGLSIVAVFSAGGAVLAGPRTELAVSEVDVGELVRGQTAEAVFTIRNTGDETLRILRADPG